MANTQTLIDQNQRLVITTEHGTPPPSWVHHLWDIAWDTPYSFDTTDDFRVPPTGDTENTLFLVNHWLAENMAFRVEAKIAKSSDVLQDDSGLLNEAGQRLNFIAVDWYHEGALFDVTRALNQRLAP